MTRTISVQVRQGARVGVLVLSGDVDIAVHEDLRSAVARMLSSGVPGIVVDLSRLEFTDCTGINALAVLAARAAVDGRPVVLAAAPAALDRLLRILDLHTRFRHEPTLRAALSTVDLLVAEFDRAMPGGRASASDSGSAR